MTKGSWELAGPLLSPRRSAPLVEVYCQNALCPFFLKRGKRQLAGRISECAELRCPSCRDVARYDVRDSAGRLFFHRGTATAATLTLPPTEAEESR